MPQSHGRWDYMFEFVMRPGDTQMCADKTPRYRFRFPDQEDTEGEIPRFERTSSTGYTVCCVVEGGPAVCANTAGSGIMCSVEGSRAIVCSVTAKGIMGALCSQDTKHDVVCRVNY
jgi:hypothetical protein